MDFKNIKFYEGNVVGEETTSEVTIDDDDFCSVFEGKNTFAKLQEAVMIQTFYFILFHQFLIKFIYNY